MLDIDAAHRVDQAHVKAQGHRFSDVGGADGKHALAAERVIHLRGGAVQAETDDRLSRGDFPQQIVEQKAVAVHGDAPVAELSGRLDARGQLRVQSRFPSQENKVRLPGRVIKELQPLLHGFAGNGGCPVLGRVDVAMAAGEVAGRENMEENVSFPWLKADSSGGGSSHGSSFFCTE